VPSTNTAPSTNIVEEYAQKHKLPPYGQRAAPAPPTIGASVAAPAAAGLVEACDATNAEPTVAPPAAPNTSCVKAYAKKHHLPPFGRPATDAEPTVAPPAAPNTSRVEAYTKKHHLPPFGRPATDAEPTVAPPATPTSHHLPPYGNAAAETQTSIKAEREEKDAREKVEIETQTSIKAEREEKDAREKVEIAHLQVMHNAFRATGVMKKEDDN
jgi:hypothetical protein